MSNLIGGATSPFIRDPANAAVVRYLQDQPIEFAPDKWGRTSRATFMQKLAQSVDCGGRLNDYQSAIVEDNFRSKGWTEPPRFDAFEGLIERHGKPLMVLWMCPGTCPPDDAIREFLVRAKAAGVDALHTIGPVWEITWDDEDPRIEPSRAEKLAGQKSIYVTPLWRMLNHATAHHASHQQEPTNAD
jgi:hypothetical protein